MGLRELLGLPPKNKGTPPPPVEDPGAWNKVEGQYRTLVADPRYLALPDDQRRPLEIAWTNASMLAHAGKYGEGTEVLRPAMALVASNVVAYAKAGQVFSDAATRASGLLDAAALLGVAGDHVSALRKLWNDAKGKETTDLMTASREMAALVETLRTDPQILAARNARDRVLKERPALEIEIGEALKTPPETETAVRALRQLTHASAMIGNAAGRLDYIGALTHMTTAARLVGELRAEANAIAEAIKLRDKVLQARALLEADVVRARLVYGTTDEAKETVKTFNTIDRAYEGAIKARNYLQAQGEVKRLGPAAARVLTLEAAAQEDMRRNVDSRKVLDEVKRRRAIWLNTPPVTVELKAVSDRIALEDDVFWPAWAERRHDDIAASGKRMIELFDEYDRLVATAAEDQRKRDEAVQRWNAAIKPRTQIVLASAGRSAPYRAAQDTVRKLEADAVIDFNAMDYDAFGKSMDTLEKALDEAERLEKLDGQMKSDRDAAMKAFNPLRTRMQAVTGAPAATPEFRTAQKLVEAERDTLDQMVRACDPGALAQVAVLEKAITAAEGLAAENTKAAADKKNTTMAVLKKAFVGLNAAIRQLEALLPHSADDLKVLTDGKALVNGFYTGGRYDDALEAWAVLQPKIGEATGKVAGWNEDVARDRKAATERRAALAGDIGKLAGLVPVNKEFKGLIDTYTQASQAWTNAESGGKWAAALAAVGALEQAVAALVNRLGDYATVKADSDFVALARGRSKTPVETAIAEFATQFECVDLQARMKTELAIATKAAAAEDFALARKSWTELEQLLGLWAVAWPKDQSASPPEVQEINKRWGKMAAERAIALQITAVPKDIKAQIDAFWKADRTFFALYEAREWAEALVAIGALETATTALAARKGDNDNALIVAGQEAQVALTELKSKSVDDLKLMPVKDRLDLLDKMRGEGRKLTDEERKVQRAVYTTLDYDPEFKKADEGRRGALIEELSGDEEITGARKDWASRAIEDRMKILMKILKAECRIYNIPEPVVRLFNVPPGPEGFFSNSDGTLNLNTHPDSGFGDFKEAMDTIVHENMHNYQHVLTQRLEEGIIVPGDAEYEQARIFALNFVPFGYVPPAENDTLDDDEVERNPYDKQPVEAHAWDTGDGVAKGVLAKSPPPKNIKL